MPPASKKHKTGETASLGSNDGKLPTPPAYGSIDYWNSRYQAVLCDESTNNCRQREDDIGDAPSAYHEWYFTYDELRPLLIPLILGGPTHILKTTENDEGELDELEGSSIHGAANDEGEPSLAGVDTANIVGRDEEESNDADGFETERGEERIVDEDDDGEEEEEEDVMRPGLATKGPITILEVGCGDCPLGAALALDLQKLFSAEQCCKQIICSDYSPVVVEVMKKQYVASEEDTACGRDVTDVGLSFEVLDATALPQPANSIEMVLEKGTIDAMLSDAKHGKRNAIKVMSECARVVAEDGCIVLISHLNAHFPSGLAWLETIVFDGIKQGDASCNWDIEVHGNDELPDEGDDGSADVPDDASGPAVYIIHKSRPGPGESRKETVPVRFFSY